MSMGSRNDIEECGGSRSSWWGRLANTPEQLSLSKISVLSVVEGNK